MTLAGLRRGVVAIQPFTLGVFVYGVTFGLLALGIGQSALAAFAMSAIINSGSAQTVAVGALASGAGLLATVLTVALLNARYLLYGATLQPWLGQVGGVRAYATLFCLGDQNWLLSMNAREAGETDAGFVLGSGLACYVAWLAGTLLGSQAGGAIPSPATLGLDFLLVAFCAAMGVSMVGARLQAGAGGATAVTAAAALAAALLADRWAAPGWPIVAAGLVGIGAAWAMGEEAPA